MNQMQLADMLLRAARVARVDTLVEVGKLPAYISQRQAYELYGEGNVKNWIKWGKVNRIKDGERNCAVRMSRVELESCAQVHNGEWYDFN